MIPTSSIPPQEFRATLENMCEELQAMQQNLRFLILQHKGLVFSETMTYNNAMFYLQAAREELKQLHQTMGERIRARS